jgi:hypothetical protein
MLVTCHCSVDIPCSVALLLQFALCIYLYHADATLCVVLHLQLASDMVVAFAMITLHGAVLMCQAIVFAVAMNSKRHALLALLIASNFVEIKGTVNKRTDTNKLWTLVCQVSGMEG